MVNFKNIFSNIYKDRKVLVTGHTGFKGSWLTLWLLELGAEVCGFSLYLPSRPCNFDALGLRKKIRHSPGDIRNIEEIRKVFKRFKPEVVFHLAAQTIVRKSYDEPKRTFDTNLGGTVNVLECIRESPCVKAGVIITSDKCYENTSSERGYKETDRLGGDDPYSASKACAEIAASAYIRSYFKDASAAKIVTTRAGNVIGGGDWADDRIVPDCMRAWSSGQELIIRNPHATRPWQHVLEPLSGYLWLGTTLLKNQQGIAGEAYNFGPDSGVVKSVGALAKMLKKFFPKGSWRHTPAEKTKKEATLLQLSCKKAFSHLAWRPTLDFKETITMTAQWYKNYYMKKDSHAFSCQQIRRYIEKARKKKIVWALR